MNGVRSTIVLAETRRIEITERLRAAGAVTIAELEERYGISSMTARRDLAELERRGVVRRTHGGAVLPAVTAHEDSFTRRLEVDAEDKRRLAAAAVELLTRHETIYLDCSSTTYYVARRLVETGSAATVLTNSLAVMDLLSRNGGPELDVVGIGGTLRRLTGSFVGPAAVHTVQRHFADRLFFSVKGIAGNGMLTDADPLEAELKRAMLAQAAESVLLVDRSKLSARGLSAIAPIADVTLTLACGLEDAEADALRLHGASVRAVSSPATPELQP